MREGENRDTKREIERERESERERQRQTGRQRGRETGRERELGGGEVGREIDTYSHLEGQIDLHSNRKKDQRPRDKERAKN